MRESLRTGSLNQRLLSTGSETTITFKVPQANAWSNGPGITLIGSGESAEHVYFTGVTTLSTTNGVSTQRLDGTVRGIKPDATSVNDADNAFKRDHKIGDTLRWVLHSAEINLFPELNGGNIITGTLSFNNTTTAPFLPPVYTVVQRDALTGVATGSLIYNADTGLLQVYVGGNWVDIVQSTPTSFATTSAAGVAQIATSQQKQDMDATDSGTGAPLFIQNNDTERTLHPDNENSSGVLQIGKGATGSRYTEIGLYADDTNTTGSFTITRDADTSGNDENADTVFTHRGTGKLVIDMPQNGNFEVNTGGSISFITGTGGVGNVYIAGANIGAGVAVYFDSADSKVKPAANTSKATSQVIGITANAGVTDGPITVVEHGVVTVPSFSLTIGSDYYLTTAGGFSPAYPSTGSLSTFPVKIGTAISSTKLLVDISRIQRIIRSSGNIPATFFSDSGPNVIDLFDYTGLINFYEAEIYYTTPGQSAGTGSYQNGTQDTFYGDSTAVGATSVSAAGAIVYRNRMGNAGGRVGVASLVAGNILRITCTLGGFNISDSTSTNYTLHVSERI